MGNILIYCAKFLITSYTSILAPLLPLLMTEMHLSLTQTGALVSVFSLFNSLLQPLFGWTQDRIGFYFFLCFAPLWTGIFMGAIGIASSYGFLILFLLLAGLGICAFHPASFASMGKIDPERRAITISFLLMATSLGFVVGPMAISFFVTFFGIHKLYLIAIPGILITLALFKTVEHSKNRPPAGTHNGFYQIKAITISIFPLFAFALCISITLMNLFSFIPFLLRERGAAMTIVGFFLSALALGSAIGPLLGSLMVKHIGRVKVLVISAISSLGFLLLFLLPAIGPILQIIFLSFLGLALMLPFSILIDMGQERVPQYLSTVSSLLGGFAWGSGGILIIVFAKIAETVGFENIIRGLIVFPVISLLLVYFTDLRYSGKPN